jgi:hypothetical protein
MAEPNWEDLLWSQVGSQFAENAGRNWSNFGNQIAGAGQGVGNWFVNTFNQPLTALGQQVANKFDPAVTGKPSTYYGATNTPMKSYSKGGTDKSYQLPPIPGVNIPPTSGAPAAAPQADSYLTLLKSLLDQANAGPSYGAALQSIRNERKGVNKRYKENQGDIKNMFGNLTTMRRGDIAGVSGLAQTGREQSAAQTSGYSQQMIDAENQRLVAANEARQALGLGEIAAAAAGGDVATEASTAQVADLGALSQIGRTASEVNQNITEQAINDEIERYSTEQDESLAELGRSRTSALSDISSREQQVLMQQAQAQAAAQQASTQLQLQIAGLIGEYEAGKTTAGTPTDTMGKFLYENGGLEDPVLGANAAYIGSSFWNWLQTESPVNPATNKPFTPQEIPSAFAAFDKDAAARLQQDPRLNNLVTALYLSASGK